MVLAQVSLFHEFCGGRKSPITGNAHKRTKRDRAVGWVGRTESQTGRPLFLRFWTQTIHLRQREEMHLPQFVPIRGPANPGQGIVPSPSLLSRNSLWYRIFNPNDAISLKSAIFN